jgi:hypothetical protein
MKPSLTDALCTTCGLCCDGSLFADVELAGESEAARLEVMGLEIDDGDAGGGSLVQPCAALQGKMCGIYAHRPKCCRTFECRLLQDVRRGTITVARAKDCIAEVSRQISRLRQLATQLGQHDDHLPLKERCTEALGFADAPNLSPSQARKRAELEATMNAVEKLVQRRFLSHGPNRMS